MPKLIKHKIGILAGMGAAAGVFFYDYLVKECQRRGATNDSDFPETIIYNLNPSAMNNTGIVDIITMETCLQSGIKLLNWAACDKILIACNSAYICYDSLQEKSLARILNMPSIAMSKCPDNYGVLSSRFSRSHNIYSGIQTSDEDQGKIDRMIGHVISGKHDAADFNDFYSIIKRMTNHGASKIILGCTELSILGDQLPNSMIQVIDASKEAVKELFND